MESISAEGILAEKDLVPIIAEIGGALTALVLFGRDSQKLAKQEELNFQEADMKELMGITANKTFGAVVTEEQALANGADIIDTKMVRTKKLDGTLKSRLCGRGFTQKEGQSFWQTFCPTPMLPSILTTVAIAAQFDYDIFGADSTQAFLQPDIPSHMKGKIFVKLPKDIDIEGFHRVKSGSS